MDLSLAQKKQINYQIKLHLQNSGIIKLEPIKLGKGIYLSGLNLFPEVLRPMSSKRLAAYIYRLRKIIKGKTIIDIGSGCGIQGIVAAQFGAKKVILSDYTKPSFLNTKANINKLGLENTCDVRQGDLFENVPEVADIIIFAQPYFLGKPDPTHPFTYGMLDEGDLIHHFLKEAKSHVTDRILMCHLDIAGETNDPKIQGEKHGYIVSKHAEEVLSSGEQQGRFCVYELRFKTCPTYR